MSNDTGNVPYTKRQGRLILKNPNIVEKDGKVFLEEVVYECPCGMEQCVKPYVKISTYHAHMDRARKNASKGKKRLIKSKSTPYARYKYKELSLEEGKEVLKRLKNLQDFNSNEQVRSSTEEVHEEDVCLLETQSHQNDPRATTSRRSTPDVDHDYYDDWTPDYGHEYELSPTFDYRISVEVMAQRPDLVQNLLAEENMAERSLLNRIMKIWRDKRLSLEAINAHLDALHAYNNVFPSRNQWRGLINEINPGYNKRFGCEDYHCISEQPGGTCSFDVPNSGKCAKKMVKCIRSNRILDAIRMKWNDKAFREGIMYGPTLDHRKERADGRCTSLWSANFVTNMREEYPDFFDLEEHVPLLFGIFVDGFRTSGASNSSGSVTLVCLNLPGEIRMDMENLHLITLFDGPSEPGTESWQNYLKGIVDEFKELWGGFTLDGKRFAAALVCTIQDGRAVSKTSMLCEAGHEYGCSKCTVRRTRLSQCPSHHSYSSKGNLKENHELRRGFKDTWEKKDNDFIRVRSEEMAFNEEHDKHVACGVKGKSVFLELPYWDPGECHLVCFMHTVKNFGVKLQRLVQGECESVKTRKELFERNFLSEENDRSLKPTKKRTKDDKITETLPSRKPHWTFQSDEKACEVLHQMKTSSNLCVQPTRLFRKTQVQTGLLRKAGPGNKDIGDKDTGGSAPMKQFLLTGVFSTVLYYGGVDLELVEALDDLLWLLRKLTAPVIDMHLIDSLEEQIWEALCSLEHRIPVMHLPLAMHNLGHIAHQVRMFGPLSETWAYPLESYLGHLKGLATNKKDPTATIFNRHMYNWSITYVSSLLDEEDECTMPKYVDKLQLQGQPRARQLTQDELHGIRAYIEKRWNAFKELDVYCKERNSENPWKLGQCMTPVGRKTFQGRKLKILNGIFSDAESYARCTINRSSFSTYECQVRDDRVVLFGNRAGILQDIVQVQVSNVPDHHTRQSSHPMSVPCSLEKSKRYFSKFMSFPTLRNTRTYTCAPVYRPGTRALSGYKREI